MRRWSGIGAATGDEQNGEAEDCWGKTGQIHLQLLLKSKTACGCCLGRREEENLVAAVVRIAIASGARMDGACDAEEVCYRDGSEKRLAAVGG